MKSVIKFLKLAVLLGAKDLTRKTLVNSFHVVIQPEGKEWNCALSLSLSEKGSSHSWMASVETPLSFNVSHTSKNTERCKFGSSKGVPPNWDCCTMEMRASLSAKLFALMFRRAMLEAMPWTPGETKSLSVLLWSSPLLAIFIKVLLASHVCSSSSYFFLFKQKVLSILESGSYRNGLRINGKYFCKHNHQHCQSNQTINKKEKKKKIKHWVNIVRLTQQLTNWSPTTVPKLDMSTSARMS